MLLGFDPLRTHSTYRVNTAVNYLWRHESWTTQHSSHSILFAVTAGHPQVQYLHLKADDSGRLGMAEYAVLHPSSIYVQHMLDARDAREGHRNIAKR